MFSEVITALVSGFNRYFKLVMCVGLAVTLVWRGQSMSGFGPNPLVAPVMCMLTAAVLVFTGLALTFAEQESEMSN